ncbi:MAG: T9SS C-terminal target domain-containing protein, partial [Calditrichaeota bacterium]
TPTTFVILDENKTVTAHFIYGTNDRATLTITANPPEGGSTQPLTGSYEYPLNQVVNVSAAALSGYTFIGWTGDVANPASSTTTVTMSANKSIIANFQKDGSGTFVLSMNVSPVGTGTTAPPPGISMHSAGSYVNISAIPLEGYYFAGWHGEVEDVLSPTTRVKMDKNKEVYAKFERGESKKYNLTLVIYPPGAGLCAPPEGTFTYDENEYVNITTIPNPGYVFKDWTGDVENPSAQTTRIKMTGHKTVIANFEKIAPNEVMLTIAVNPTGSGVTVPDEGSHSYEIGRVVNLTAAPKAGYRFLNWSGSVADPNSATTTITMSGDRTITANFTPNRFTVSMAVTPQGSGSTVPSAGDTLVSAGDALTLVAKPAAGFRFAYWSGDASGEELRTTLQVTKAMQIIANFVELNETITTPKIYAVTSAYKQQSVDFNVRNAVSNLGHNVEYQFDWGDGQTSAWTDLTSQQNTNITMFTTPVGGSGLPSSGYLVNYGDGIATPVQLSVQGGIYYGKQDAWLGEEPVAGTDAKDIFGNSVNCRGAISYVDSPGDELTLHFSGLNPVKLYIIAFYSNRNDYGWLRSSVVTLSGADSFLNLSSRGKDDVGNVLFNNNFSPNTRLPSDNTAPGYVAKFANIIAGGDGEVMLSVRFGGKAGNEYKGKYGSAVMLQEIDPLTQKASYTAFNDLAWEGDFYAHKYSTTGTFLVRARARCKNHTSAISGWSSAHSLMTSGIVVNAVVADAANAVVNRIPDYPEYEYGTQLTLVATPGKNWAFSHWNDDRTDTLEVKQVLVNNQKTFRANFRLTAAVAAKETALPESFSLLQNFPNPFNPTTEIQYDLPRPEHVKIDVFDIRGRWVTTLVDMQMPAGRFKVIWNATDELNLRVPTGLYFYRMTAGSFVEIRRMVLLK